MVSWCLDLDGRRDRDECAKPTIGRASNLAYGNVAVFFMVRLQEAEMRKVLQGNNRAGGGVRSCDRLIHSHYRSLHSKSLMSQMG